MTVKRFTSEAHAQLLGLGRQLIESCAALLVDGVLVGHQVGQADAPVGADLAEGDLTLLQPLLAPLPLLAGVAAAIYLSADQILCLPLSLIGGLNPVAAFQGSRAATDPHWLHALGLTLVLLAMVLAGFLVLVVGLVVALPVATCTKRSSSTLAMAFYGAMSPPLPVRKRLMSSAWLLTPNVE